MKVSIKELKPIVLEWLDKVVIPSASPIQVFGLTFAIAQMNTQIEEFLGKAKVFADNNDDLNLNEIAQNARTALKRAGGTITLPYLNWNFDGDDLEALVSIAKEHAHD